ncbi:MAG TPA: cytochrome c peroxidase, partial [Vicinamibacterales bacterium]|nr:cytochrome c peroxidase [Vicinamibacterales bacterium]
DLLFPVPGDNPLTGTKVELGRVLFGDPLLSRDRSLACAGCHDPKRAFTDGRPRSVGVFDRLGGRNVPTLVNRAYGRFFFWDGRTTTLEAQVLRPIEDSREMDLTAREAVDRLRAQPRYVAAFHDAFGREPTIDDLARAVASYVRTILSGGAPFDRYARGEADALSPAARAGLQLFRGKANCVSCHPQPSFTDERFHNTGVAWRDGALRDVGREAVTGNREDRGAFKTPTLREVARTAPYMHDGSVETLEDVIEFYDRGGNVNPYRDPRLSRLDLSAEEKRQLLAFLRSLSGAVQEGLSAIGPVHIRPALVQPDGTGRISDLGTLAVELFPRRASARRSGAVDQLTSGHGRT